MDKFIGYWDLENSENFDNYMKKIGVEFTLRTVGDNTKLSVEIVKDNDEYFLLKTHSTFNKSEVKFQLNKELDETTVDGRPVKTTFTLEGNKLVQTQKGTKPDDKDSVIIREVQGDILITKETDEDRHERIQCARANRRYEIYEAIRRFRGRWNCLSYSNNMYLYLIQLGVKIRHKKSTDLATASFEITKKNEGYVLKTYSDKNTELKLKFQLNKELDDWTIDGRPVKTTFTLNGNKLIQTQKATKLGDKDNEIIREVQGDKLIALLRCDGVEVVCTYARDQTL